MDAAGVRVHYQITLSSAIAPTLLVTVILEAKFIECMRAKIVFTVSIQFLHVTANRRLKCSPNFVWEWEVGDIHC